MDAGAIAYIASVWVLPVLLAVTMHEAAHGLVADRLGDDTARRAGRVTLNPIKHIHPIGTILLPGLLLALGAPFLFGFAKPVPVVISRLRRPRRDGILVALAGPAANIVLACLGMLLVNLVLGPSDSLGLWLYDNAVNLILINLWLAAFNLLPVPPLDGGRVLLGLLPAPFAALVASRERHIALLLLASIFLIPLLLGRLGINFNPIHWILGPVVRGFLTVIETLFLFVGAAA